MATRVWTGTALHHLGTEAGSSGTVSRRCFSYGCTIPDNVQVAGPSSTTEASSGARSRSA
eukprot:4222150-Amphidinium_carterae.1